MQARWGTHGDYTAIALSPNSVQEMFDLTVRAFNLADHYRTPVILLADEIVAHLREQLDVPSPDSVQIVDRKKPKAGDTAFFGLPDVAPMPAVGEGFNVAVTASTHDEYGVRFTQNPMVHRRIVKNINSKIADNADDIADVEAYRIDNCEVGIVSFGCTSRAVYEAVDEAEARGVRVGFVRLKTIWPFPEKAVRTLANTARKIIVPEMNLGQVYHEVQRIASPTRVVPLNKIGGGELITPEELLVEITEGKK